MRPLWTCFALAAITIFAVMLPLPASAQALPKPEPEVRILITKALAALDERDPKAAVRLSTQAMALAKLRRDLYGEGDAARVLFQAYYADHQPNKAQNLLEQYQKTLPSRRAAGDRKGAADTLAVLGTLYALQAHWQQALDGYEQELKLRRAMNDRLGEAWALVRIGWLDTNNSRHKLESFQKALGIFGALGNKLGQAEVFDFLAQSSLGHPHETLDYLQKSLRIYQSIGDHPTAFGDSQTAIGALLRRIGDEYHYRLTDPQKALDYYEQALPYLRAAGNSSQEGFLLSAIGEIHSKQPQKALEFYLKALPIAQASRNYYAESRTLVAIGDAYRDTAKPREALEYYQKALTVAPLSSSTDLEPQASFAIGDVYSSLGQPLDAVKYYQRTVSIYEKLRPNIGSAQSRSRYLASRLFAYYRCLQILVQLNKSTEAFALAQETKARSLLDLLAAGRIDLHFGISPKERQEEQALADKASHLNVLMVREGVENKVGSKKRYQALKTQLQGVEDELQALTDTLYDRHPRLAQRQVARTVKLAEIAKVLPSDTALLEYVVVSAEDVRVFIVTNSGGQPRLSTHRVSTDYAGLREDAARLHAACADPRKEYSPDCQKLYDTLILPVEKELEGKKRLVICPDGALWDVPFTVLLPGPAGGTAAVQPENEGSLSTFLGARFEIAYAYSATGAEAALRLAANRHTAPQGLLIAANPAFGTSDRFGDLKEVPGQRPIDSASRPIDAASRPIDGASRPLDFASRAFEAVSRSIDLPPPGGSSTTRGKAIPTLPGTQLEADFLRKLFPDARVLTGAKAQEAAVKRDAGRYRFLHFATHGFVNDGSPLLSSVVLAKPSLPAPNSGGAGEDGFLTAREIYDLNLNAEMTVLSACNTARGETRTGEGVIGLTWALFVAGCPTQVVSQWAVDDKSTAMLMGRFYEDLKVRKMGKAAALKEAEGWLQKQDPKYKHPYYWAPFVLNGAWK